MQTEGSTSGTQFRSFKQLVWPSMIVRFEGRISAAAASLTRRPCSSAYFGAVVGFAQGSYVENTNQPRCTD